MKLTGVFILGAVEFGFLVALYLRRRQGTIRAGPVLALTLPVLLAAFILLGELDALAAGMRRETDAPAHLTEVTSAGASLSELRGNRDPSLATLLFTWQRWEEGVVPGFAGSIADVSRVSAHYLTIDSLLFIPAYALVLIFLLLLGSSNEPLGAGDASPFAHAGRRIVPLVFGVVALDWTENYLAWRLIEGGSTSVKVLALVSLAKWAFTFVLVPVAAFLAFEAIISRHRSRVESLRTLAATLRGHLGVLAIMAILLLFVEPTLDVVRRWKPLAGAITLGLALLTGFALWATATALISLRVMAAPDPSSEGQHGPGLLTRSPRATLDARPLLSLRAIVIAGLLMGLWGFAAHGLWVAAAIVGLVAVLSWLIPASGPSRGLPPAPYGRAGLARALGLAPLYIVSLAALRGYLANDVMAERSTSFLFWELAAWIIGMPLFLFALYHLFRLLERELLFTWSFRLSLATAAASLTMALLKAHSDVWDFGFTYGALGVLFLFFLCLVWLVATIAWLSEGWQPPVIFGTIGFHRVPIFALMLLVWLPLNRFVSTDELHDVRVTKITATSFAEATLTTEEAVTAWIDRFEDDAVSTPPKLKTRQGIPMIFVAGSGGGIRAAVWTSYVLDCLFSPLPINADQCPRASALVPEENRREFLFAASGVSGSSLGLMTYEAHIQLDEDPAGTVGQEDWIEQALGEDFLGPSFAWQYFVEAPNAFLRFEPEMDRAEVLERSWEHTWPEGSDGQGPLESNFLEWRSVGDGPILILNGTSVEDGCRFAVSALESNPGTDGACVGSSTNTALHATREALDFLCDGSTTAGVGTSDAEDLRFSTAALLSARFPVASPFGRLSDCGDEAATFVVDGGYLEGAGSGPAVELWDSVEPIIRMENQTNPDHCFIPFFIQIDNSFQDVLPATPASRPGQFSGLRSLLGELSNARAVAARSAAADIFGARLPADVAPITPGTEPSTRYVRLFPRVQAGSEPPLSWTLSSKSIGDLRGALRGNVGAIQAVAQWFSGESTCRPTPTDERRRGAPG